MTDDERRQLEQWIRSGGYVPRGLPQLRDFHSQKDVFKLIGSVGGTNDRPGDVSWVQGHIYTMDRFLPAMAAHGWVLARSRKPLAFGDLAHEIEEWRARDTQALLEMMGPPK